MPRCCGHSFRESCALPSFDLTFQSDGLCFPRQVFGRIDTVGASTLDGWWEFSIASGTWQEGELQAPSAPNSDETETTTPEAQDALSQEIWPRDPGLRDAGLSVSAATVGGAATFEPCRKAMLMHGGGSFYFFAAPSSLGTVEFRLGVDA